MPSVFLCLLQLAFAFLSFVFFELTQLFVTLSLGTTIFLCLCFNYYYSQTHITTHFMHELKLDYLFIATSGRGLAARLLHSADALQTGVAVESNVAQRLLVSG